LAALREFGDRMDGKPAQAIVGDEEHAPIRIGEIVIRGIPGVRSTTESP
jgi:hypothetical protein